MFVTEGVAIQLLEAAPLALELKDAVNFLNMFVLGMEDLEQSQNYVLKLI